MKNNKRRPSQKRYSGKEYAGAPIQSGKIDTLIATLNSLSEGLIITGKNGHFIFINSAATRILGIGLKNITPEKWTSVYGCYYPDKRTPYPPGKLPLALAVQGEIIKNERIFITNAKKPEGVFISVDASPVKDAHGFIIGGSVVLRDISETVRSETEMKETRERLKAQFEGYPQPTYVWQHSGDDFILIDYNHAAKNFNQGSIKKHIGTKLSAMYEDVPQILADITNCFANKSTLRRELTYALKNKQIRRNWIIHYVYLPPDLIMVHTEDITERMNNERELQKLSRAVQQTADSVFLTDKNGMIEYVNKAFEETTGYTAAEVIGKTPAILKSGKHDQLFYQSLWEIIMGGYPYTGSIMNKKKNGEIYWGEQSITPMKDGSGNITHFVSVIKDISLFKKKQKQDFYLRIAREIQQRLSQTKLSIPGFDIAGAIYSALETSGDYFDFIHTDDGHVLLAVGDVCGHGIGAALIMAETRAYLRAFAKNESNPAALLSLLNKELNSDLDEQHYVTLILARIDPAQKLLDYANAGHIPAYLLNSAGAVTQVLTSTGMPLGFMAGEIYTQSEAITLNSGDILTLLSDGVTEALTNDEDEFGHERMIRIINKQHKDSAQQIADQLIREVCLFTDQPYQEDDITSVICKVI